MVFLFGYRPGRADNETGHTVGHTQGHKAHTAPTVAHRVAHKGGAGAQKDAGLPLEKGCPAWCMCIRKRSAYQLSFRSLMAVPPLAP